MPGTAKKHKPELVGPESMQARRGPDRDILHSGDSAQQYQAAMEKDKDEIATLVREGLKRDSRQSLDLKVQIREGKEHGGLGEV